MIQDFLRDRLTIKQRRQIALGRVRLREPTHKLRLLPEFLVIGAQRAGTSSLYRHLSAQPGVGKPLRKEIDYFSAYFDRAPSWYRAHFPIRRGGVRTFEATPQYLVHPLAPARVAQALPDVRLIVMLRDPIGRMRSQHAHMRGHGLERLPLVDALEAEESRISDDLELIHSDDGHNPQTFFRHGYLARSLYGRQLARWFDQFDPDSFHIASFERLTADPDAELDGIHRFLKLPPIRDGALPNASRATPPKDATELPGFVRRALQEDEALLCELLGGGPPWRPVA